MVGYGSAVEKINLEAVSLLSNVSRICHPGIETKWTVIMTD